MDFKDLIGKLDQLNEAEMTSRKVAGKKYGGAAQHDDDEDDEDGEKKAAAPAEKRGRGRPKKAGGDAQVKAGYGGAKDLQDFMVGNIPKKSKELEKLGKTKHKLSDKEPTEKKKVKESLKDWIAELDQLMEAEQLTIEPAKASTQVIKQGSKVLGQVSNPQLAATIKQAIGKGEMTLAGSELDEDSEDYSAKKARAGKDIGKPGKMFSKIAKDAAERYGSKERGEKVAGAVLAKLRKTNEADMPPNDSLSSPLTLESKKGMAEGQSADGSVNYTLGHTPDSEHVYSIYRDGEKEGTYHSVDQAKRIVANMKKTSPHRSYKITRSSRSKMAGPVGQLPEQSMTEAKNHMGETEYNTYAGWKSACRKAGADKFEGDSDICQAMKDGKGIGEWDGATGSVYDDSHKKKKMAEGIDQMVSSGHKIIANRKTPKGDFIVLQNKNDGKYEIHKFVGGKSSTGYEFMSAHNTPEEMKNAFKSLSGVNESKTAKRDNRAEVAGKKVTKDLEYDMKHKGKDDNKAERAGKKVTKDIEYDEKKLPTMAHIKKMCKDGKTVAEICKMHPNCNQAELKKMVADCKKKMVAEGMDQRLKAAHHRGKAHALAKEGYNCRYDEGTEESRMYHEGYKMGLDECYGIMPLRGVVGEESEQDVVDNMASFGAVDEEYGMMEDEMEEGNAFTAALAKTPRGGKFSVGGKTFTDNTGYDAKVDEMSIAFEGWDKQLSSLLIEGEEVVEEGMSISVSKGQQGSPDSVSVTASDSDADKLMALVRQMGILGDEAPASDYGSASTDSVQQHGDLTVVDDHDGMMALIKKVAGPGMDSGMDSQDSEDYADEEGHSHEETCNECGGMMEAGHSCGQEVMGEEESEDQMEFEVAEDNAPDSDEAETAADEESEAAEDQALATKSISEEDEEDEEEEEGGYDAEGNQKPGGPYDAGGHYVGGYRGYDDYIKDRELDEDEEDEEEEDGLEESFANSADDTFEADMDFMTKVISGGLNKQKSTGQATIPVVASQMSRLGNPMSESTDLLSDWRKLSGIK
jgi:hypothetical protein